MRVDQTATATPTVTALPATRTIKEETRTPVAIARTEAAPSARVDGLRVSISDAARQAANAAGAAAAADSSSGGEAAAVSSAQSSGVAQPLSLIEGVPWPVGVGPPPPWQPAQGAAGAASLVAPKVAEQNLSQTRAPAEAEVAREEPRADVSAQVAAQAQLAAAAVPARANRELPQAQAPRSQETKPEAVQARNAAGLEARNEATRLNERRKASAVYANEAGQQTPQNLALNVKV
ncbi:MAG: hypothetical protein IV097_16760 [Burkholderiaceae bacterium]|nr:hypothetical protein [Burkholderiaceae bacterium]